MPDIPPVPTPENEQGTSPEAPQPAPIIPTPVVPTPTEEVPQQAEAVVEEATAPVQEAPKEETQETPMPDKPKRSGAQVLIGFLAILLGLVAVAYVFILWALVEGNFSDPQFAQFLDMVGLEPVELKAKFTLITHALFGGFSFVFLIAALIKFFQWIMTSATSMYRKTHAKKMGAFLMILILLIGIWIGVVWLISNSDAAPPISTGATGNFIVTQPTSTVGLTAPVSVEFNLESIYEKIPKDLVREIHWDFDGDGDFTDASEVVVTNRFLNKGDNNGRFEVGVEVIYFSPNVNEERTYTETHNVIVSNVAAAAVMTATPEVGSVPLTVRFSAEKSTDADGAIIQYEWDLDGDGEFEIRGAEEKEIEKVFYQIGEHPVRLRITGQNHDFSLDEKVITVVAAEEKVRAEIASPDSSFVGMVPHSITLDGAQSYTRSGRIVKYEWRVKGEAKSFVGRKIQRVFETPGEYEVTLTVENEDGDRDETTQVVNVFARREMNIKTLPKADDAGIVRGTIPFEVTFDATNSEIPHAVEWHWDFDSDGVVDEFSDKSTYVFREPGVYDVKLTIVDADDHEFYAVQKVMVDKLGVMAKISATPVSGSVPLTVELDGGGSQTSEGEIIDYIWTFPGEEPIHYNAKISREFRQVGVFPVKLEVLTSSGERAETEIFVSVRGKVLQSEFDASPMAGAAPLNVQFSPTQSTGNIQSYFWTFSDGSVSTDPYPEHKFMYAGDFPVTLKLTDIRGLVSEVTKIVKVTEAAQ